ncbi:MAG: hypothetical protein RIB67_11860 [Miltoncostaeaceae bacterium]
MDATAAVLGHPCPERRDLEASLAQMGLVVMSADADASDRPPGCGDMLVADLRGGPLRAPLLSRLHDDPRPLVIIAGHGRRALAGLVGRPAGTMVLSADDLTAGLRVAITVCSGMVRRAAPPEDAPGIPGLRTGSRRTSATAR